MAIKIASWLIATILGAILYRLGGAAGYNTKWRDLGLPAVSLVYLLICGKIVQPWGFWWLVGAYLLTFGLFFGSLTTYWKKKGEPAKWISWLLTGLGYSLAFLPYAILSGEYFGFCLRLVLCSVGIMIWSEKISNVVWEECGRGAIAIGTLFLLTG